MKTRQPTPFAEVKRRAILDAAMAEFEAKGPEKASLRAIAAGAGMTTGAIYSQFGGKDDLYAALLGESLDRLYDFVVEQTAIAPSPIDRVRASVRAFYDYYAGRLFEVQLGMYSFGGFTHGSLGRERDASLNAALIRTLDVIGGAIAEVRPSLNPDEVEAERNAAFSCLLGALTLAHTGRATSVGTTSEAVLDQHIDVLVDRLSA